MCSVMEAVRLVNERRMKKEMQEAGDSEDDMFSLPSDAEDTSRIGSRPSAENPQPATNLSQIRANWSAMREVTTVMKTTNVVAEMRSNLVADEMKEMARQVNEMKPEQKL